jgi:SPP1 family phage portal protein
MPQNTQELIRTIESQNEKVISAMLWDLIEEHKLQEGNKQKELDERYRQTREGVPIFKKKFANYEKVTEKIPDDFFGDIVDLKTGYMGNEIIIGIDARKVENEAERDDDDLFLSEFSQQESLLDENSELLKTAVISGKAYRLLYVSSEDGQAKVLNSEPWETVVYRDGSVNVPMAAMRYYQVDEGTYNTGLRKMEHKKRYRVEWYDSEFITYYKETSDTLFVLDKDKPANGKGAGTGKQLHLFNGVPIVDFPNNKEAMAEASKALDLIDAYDNLISDAVSEVEQLRMAYMWARGAGQRLDEDFEEKLKQTGLWPLPADGEIGFAGKDLGGAGAFVATVLEEIRRNIYSFSKSIDLSEDRGGDTRVIGWQIALLRLEMSAQVTERKFKKSYQRQYTMLTDFWRDGGDVDIDPLSINFIFTRKFPKDIDQEIDTLVKGIEVLPLETIYSLMSFIDHPKELAEKFKDERPEMQGIIQGLEDADSQLE